MSTVVADLVDTFGESTGEITQDGTGYPFTGAVVTARRRRPGRNTTDVETIALIVPASGVAIQPRRDDVLVFTGDLARWSVFEASPVQPGATVAAWRLTLTAWTARDDA